MPEVLQPKDPAGVETLEIMSAAPQYNSWMYQAIAPFLGTRILEVGSGIGNMSAHLLSAQPARLVLTDMDPWYRDQVGRRFGDHAEVTVSALTLPDPDASQRFSSERLDTVVALNVVEHIGDDVGAMTSMRQMLVPGGRAVILVPALPSIYGELDRELGHFRRYDRDSLGTVFRSAGLRVSAMFWFNRVGVAGWWFNGKIRRVKRISLGQLKRFDAMVPMLRLERFLPLPFGQSLIAVGPPV